MAGDWIKVEIGTPDKPEVWDIAARLNIDPDAVFGKLFRVWSWFDQHSENGNATRVTKMLLDRAVGVTGFCDAMCSAGWMLDDGRIVSLPNFGRHNGETAKSRALTAKRVQKYKRNNNAHGNGAVTHEVTDKALPREEKRREEKETTPLPPSSPEGLNADAWNEWDAYRKQAKLRAVKRASVLKQQRWLVSQGPPDIQQRIVDQSIRNNWQGLFELKKGDGNGSHQQSGKPSLAERASVAARESLRAIDQREADGGVVGQDDASVRSPLDGEFRRVRNG